MWRERTTLSKTRLAAALAGTGFLRPHVALAATPTATEATTELWPVLVGVLVCLGGIIAVHYALRFRSGQPALQFGEGERKINDASYQIAAISCLFALFGAVAAFLAAYGSSPPAGAAFTRLFGLYLLVSAAGAAVGGVAGFIFGIPRTTEPAARAAVAGAAETGGVGAKANAVFAANTNLERISDWLTTLLIGATLVQIGSILRWIKQFAEYLGTENGRTHGPLVLLLVYFFALAFLGIYLITRLYLTAALTQALGMQSGGAGITKGQSLRAFLESATATSDPKDLRIFVTAIDNWQLDPDDKDDPALNAVIVKALYRYIMAGSVEDRDLRVTQMKNAAKNTLADPVVRDGLKSFFVAEQAKWGEQSLPGDMIKTLQDS